MLFELTAAQEPTGPGFYRRARVATFGENLVLQILGEGDVAVASIVLQPLPFRDAVEVIERDAYRQRPPG